MTRPTRVGARVRLLGGACLLLALASCTARDEARAVAQAFLDRYYLEIDHRKALPLTTGLARLRLEREMELLAPTRAVPGAAPVAKPKVYYDFVRQMVPGRDRVYFVYRLTVRGDESPLTKEVSLTLSREPDGWKVTSFREHDVAG